MKHILLFFWILCYSIGITNLVFTFLLWRRNRDAFLKIHLILLAAFTSMVLSLTLLHYSVNYSLMPVWTDIFGTMAYISCGFLAYALFNFANAVIKLKNRKKISAGFGIFMIVLTAAAVLDSFLPVDFYLEIILQGMLGLSIIYTTALTLFHRNKRDDDSVYMRNMGPKLAVVSAVCIPGFIIVDIFYDRFPFLKHFLPRGFYFLPLFYLFWSVLNIRECWNSYFNSFPLENAVSSWGLSEREKEVLLLLAQGKTYGAMADELCVSLSTARAGWRNWRCGRRDGVD